jgi:hypothetical protein
MPQEPINLAAPDDIAVGLHPEWRLRELKNGWVHGSAEGPAITIDWDKHSITFHRMSARRVRRIVRWLSNA